MSIFKVGTSVIAFAAIFSPALCGTALAETSSGNPNETPQRADGGAGLGDIVVTARRRAERLQDVPVAVSAISEQRLAALHVVQADQLPQLVPNLQVGSFAGQSQPNFTLRGVGTANQFNVNTAQPIGIYVDEVYQTFRPTQGAQIFDLERLEVVRGPQGTLFGRNTTAGAISYITRKPTLDGNPDAYVKAGIGRFSRFAFEAASDFELGSDMAARAAVIYRKGKGSVENVGDGPDFASVDSFGGRLTLRWQPSADVDVNLTGFYNRDNPVPPASFSVGLGPGGTNPYGYSRNGLGDFQAESDHTGRVKTHAGGVTLNVNVKLDDALSLVSVTSYSKAKLRQRSDPDGSPSFILGFHGNVDGDQMSEDLRLNYESPGFNLVAGVYYGRDYQKIRNQVEFYPYTPAGGIFRYNFDQRRQSYALYSEASYELVPRLTLALGGRYTRDRNQFFDAQAYLVDKDVGGTPIVMTIPASLTFDPNLYAKPLDKKDGYFSGRAILSYKVTNDILLFGSYSRGWRSGNFNGQPLFSEAEILYIKPERVDDFELGLKSSLFDRRLTFNLTAFYMKYKRQQVQDQIAVGSSLLTTLRGFDGTIKGLEVESNLRISDGLSAYANLGLLDSKYDDGQATFAGPIGGNPFPYAPDITVQGGFDARLYARDESEIHLYGNAFHSGKFAYTPEGAGVLVGNTVYSHGGRPYWLFDARLAFTVQRNFEFSLWGKNLSNERYFPFFSNTQALGFDFGIIGERRTWGAEVKYSF
ncbi:MULTISPECIES: TonB-dependent receptor [Sphingobium]|uniref:TonB-dependent receptor n=1 Tax=Sphingobium TaxID=165695 RepID=UPI00159C51AE|nr:MULTISPECIES: TonB-dependent receptor [unclassified Sphingobium]